MDRGEEGIAQEGQEHVCHCGHTFAQRGHLSYHQRSCRTTKSVVVGALAKAREVLKTRKKRRRDPLLVPSPSEVRNISAILRA